MAHTDAKRGYGFETHRRDGFQCVHCGLDGTTSFENWLMLEVEHLLPAKHSRRDAPEFKVTACRSCNGAANWYFKHAERDGYSFDGVTPDQLIERRRSFVMQSREAYLQFWREQVAGSEQNGVESRPPITEEMIEALMALARSNGEPQRASRRGEDDGIKRFYTPKELSKRWEVGSDKIIRWIRSGELRASDLSQRPGMKRPRYRIPVDAMLEFEERRRVTKPVRQVLRRRRKPPSSIPTGPF